MPKAIIIGASSGLGKELALVLAANNYQVGITGRRAQFLTDLQKTQPERFTSLTLDVVDENATIHLDKLVQALGGLDVLIISAGTGELNPKLNFELEQNTIAVNVSGFTRITDWAFNLFAKQQHGHLVAITSVGGLRGSRHAPAYNASKAYQINYLEGLRQRVQQLKVPIYITDIRPGSVKTAMMKGEGHFWIASPQKAARQIYQVIVKKVAVQYVTKRWMLIGWLLKMIPSFLYKHL